MPTYAKGKIYKLAVPSLQPNPGQARTFMDPGSLAEMTASIVKHGVLQPILFRGSEGGRPRVHPRHSRRWKPSGDFPGGKPPPGEPDRYRGG